MLGYDNVDTLHRASEKLKDAIWEYIFSRLISAEEVPRERVFKSWRCARCQAQGRVASSPGGAIVEAIRRQHRRWRRINSCDFDQDMIVVAPIASTEEILIRIPDRVAAPALVMTANRW